MTGVADKIMRKVRSRGQGGAVFTPKDFLGLAPSRSAVDKALSRLVRDGKLRRISRGLYDWPRENKLLGSHAPAGLDAVVDAVARRQSIHVMPDNLVAANNLGLTNAVPSKAIYLTDGPTKTMHLGGWTIHLKHAPSHLMAWRNEAARPIVQSMYWLGESLSNAPDTLAILRKCVNANVEARRSLSARVNKLPPWAMVAAMHILGPAAYAKSQKGIRGVRSLQR